MRKILLLGLFGLGMTTPGWSIWYHTWSRSVGSTGTEMGTCVAQDADVHTVSAGYFSGTVDFDAGAGVTNLTAAAGSTDMYIIKKNNAGTLLWAKQVGGPGTANPQSILADAGGDIYVCGYFQGTIDFNFGASPAASRNSSGGSQDMFIARYSVSTGALVWVQVFGNTGSDAGMDITFDGGNNVIVCGQFQGNASYSISGAKHTLSSNSGSIDAFFGLYSKAAGAISWMKGMGGTLTEVARGVCADNSNYIYLCGSFESSTDFDPGAGSYVMNPTGNRDLFFGRYALTTGNFSTWARQAGTASHYFSAVDIAYNTFSGNISLTGSLSSGGTVTFPGGGPTYTLSSASSYLLTYNSSGTYVWGNGFPAWEGTDIDINNSGYAFVCGYFAGTTDFDIGAGTASATSVGGSDDIFMMQYTQGGTFIGHATFGNSGTDVAWGICTHKTLAHVHLTGFFESTVDFDPQATTVNHTASGWDAFHNKYSWTLAPFGGDPKEEAESSVGTGPDAGSAAGLSFYPNPASDVLFIENLPADATVELYALDGKLVGAWQNTAADRMPIDLSETENGVYLLRVTRPDGKIRAEKIVVQH